MSRPTRGEQFDPRDVCVVHVVQRCVRRAFLAGQDSVTGKDYSYRREGIRRRLEQLASVFGVDVLTYAILSNHVHLILRSRPDVVSTWSDQGVAERWLRLFPGRRLRENLAEPGVADIQSLQRDSKRMSTIRLRLSDLSWFMRAVSEPIARLANREDGCTGRFWEGRFKAQRITDEAGLLACSMYVDLNPIRAAMASTPEQSEHTSAYDRIQAMGGKEVESAAGAGVSEGPVPRQRLPRTQVSEHRRSRTRLRPSPIRKILCDAWLAPLSLDERGRSGPQLNGSGIRASDKGFLNLTLPEYLELLDWTGRQAREDKRGAIPSGLAGILTRLGIEGRMWQDLVWNFKRYFGGAAGSPQSLEADASRHGRSWRRGQRSAAECFASR